MSCTILARFPGQIKIGVLGDPEHEDDSWWIKSLQKGFRMVVTGNQRL